MYFTFLLTKFVFTCNPVKSCGYIWSLRGYSKGETYCILNNKSICSVYYGPQVSSTASSIRHVILIVHCSDIRISEFLSSETKTILRCLSSTRRSSSDKPLIRVDASVHRGAGLSSRWHKGDMEENLMP